jgi:hypothetical protein
VRVALLALVAVLLAGCPSPGPECDNGVSCLSGEVCANTHECLPADQVHAVAVHWTVSGQAPNATLCQNHPQLELTIDALTTGATLTYAPVLCDLGLFNFDKLPDEYDEVTLVDPDTGDRSSASIPSAGGSVTIDLAP